MSQIDFGPYPSSSKEQVGIFKKSGYCLCPVPPEKNPVHVKNELYYQNGVVINNNE